ncbi:hypothetical protein Y032_0002g797 [Ancylostoma ceylanicum]|uniref:Uncharacterized protein n=1 Tax=Ancylostoma ceylanicum TaxID=53326 RepID=A0A016W2C1_9BILA|nr:hypothetical protein Y032_0002g797 [Ancylostoma ceylanicum]
MAADVLLASSGVPSSPFCMPQKPVPACRRLTWHFGSPNVREAVVWRDSSGGIIDRLDLGLAITARVTVTRRGSVITSPRTTRPPHHDHFSQRRTQSPARRFLRVKA